MGRLFQQVNLIFKVYNGHSHCSLQAKATPPKLNQNVLPSLPLSSGSYSQYHASRTVLGISPLNLHTGPMGDKG